MERRAPRKHVKHHASAELTPAEALMLRLEKIEPGALERLGAKEEHRIRGKRPRWLGWRMDDTSPVGGSSDGAKDASTASAAWLMSTASDGAGRLAPQDRAKVYGNAMTDHGLRHGDTVRIDRDLTPSEGDIVLAEVQGVGRVLRKLSIIGGVHVLSADAGVKPIVVDDVSLLAYYGIVVEKLHCQG